MAYDRIIRGGRVVTGTGVYTGDIGIRGGKIVAIGDLGEGTAPDVIDARHLHILPGVIDTQVHFREPGMEHKEDLESGTRAAIHGGVTTVFEMPNTNPTTTTQEALDDKLKRAEGRAWCDYAFFVGAGTDNIDQLEALEVAPGTPGVKVFVGSSTGSLLVPDDEHIRRVFEAGHYRTAIHSEDSFRLEERKSLISANPHPREHPFLRDAECARLSTERVLRLSQETGRKVHILHISTLDELPLLAEGKKIGATCEITPQHLWFFAPDCYDRLGTLTQQNPPIRSDEHRMALRHALRQGLFEVIGSDHAPHTLEEKGQPYPKSPSGMPGVQTLLPVMVTLAIEDGLLDLPTLARMTSEMPAKLYGIEGKGGIQIGNDADLVLTDLYAKRKVDRSMIQSKCGWSPFEGEILQGWPTHVFLRGEPAIMDGERMGSPAGRVVKFNRERLPAPRS